MPDCAEVKLVDEPTTGYLTSSSPPEGEIWLRSHSATDHYYNDEFETAMAFTEDGWFKTGDIGRIDARGAICIIDRKKNLVKTLNGEYIALEKVCCTTFNVIEVNRADATTAIDRSHLQIMHDCTQCLCLRGQSKEKANRHHPSQQTSCRRVGGS